MLEFDWLDHLTVFEFDWLDHVTLLTVFEFDWLDHVTALPHMSEPEDVCPTHFILLVHLQVLFYKEIQTPSRFICLVKPVKRAAKLSLHLIVSLPFLLHLGWHELHQITLRLQEGKAIEYGRLSQKKVAKTTDFEGVNPERVVFKQVYMHWTRN